MFSKGMMILLSAVLLAGCDAKIGEKAPPPTAEAFSGTQCLSAVLPNITNFVDGTAQDKDIVATWDCFGSALDKFQKYVRGSSKDRYTPQELATFLQDNFLDNNGGKKTIDPALQAQVMKFKQIFLGGSTDYLTLDEMSSAQTLFQSFKAMTLKINPYMKVYALNWTPARTHLSADDTYFEESNTTIQDVAKDMAALVQKNHPAYKLSDFPVFLRELNTLYDHPWTFVSTVDKFMPVIQKIKKSIAGGDENTIASNEWGSFLLMGGRGYMQYLRYHYFIGSTVTNTAGHISYIARTCEDVFSLFHDLVAGKPTGTVTREELGDLFKTLSTAWPDFKVSDALIYQVMKIKQLLIGGSVDAFATKDFETAGLKVSQFQTVISNLLPFVSVYTMDWSPKDISGDKEQKYFKKAQTVLADNSQQLGSLLETSYDINDAYSLVHEIAVLYPAIFSGESTLDSDLKKYMPLLVNLKNMIYAEQDSLIKKDRWGSFLGFASRSYASFLYEHYYFKGETLQTVKGLAAGEDLLNQALDILRDMIGSNPQKKFAQADLVRLSQSVVDAQILPDSLDAASLKIILSVAVNRILMTPDQRIAGHLPGGLTAPALEVLRSEAQIWLELEKFFAGLYPKGTEVYDNGQVQNLLARQAKNTGNSPALKTGLTEMRLIADTPVPATLNSKGFLIITSAHWDSYNQKSLSQLNMNRMIARLLIRSYSSSLSRINNYTGLVESEAQKAYSDLKPIAVRMQLLDEDNTTFASSRFMEANIFVAHANGDSYLSFQEGTDLVGMIWSGVSLDSTLRPRLLDNCVGHNSTTSKTRVSLKCLYSSYRQELPGVTSQMPEYQKYAQNVSEDEWENYFTNVIKAAGYVPVPQNTIALGDVSLIPHVIQYVEMIFAKYDRNHDRILDTDEALRAFPIFQSLIKQFAKGQVADKDLDAVFTFILRYGKPPETLPEKLKFLNWKDNRSKWDVGADRTQLANILGYIADQMANPSASKGMDLSDTPANLPAQ